MPLYNDRKSEESLTQMARMHAFGRIAQPGEIAYAVSMPVCALARTHAEYPTLDNREEDPGQRRSHAV
jgi:hypothetical protein